MNIVDASRNEDVYNISRIRQDLFVVLASGLTVQRELLPCIRNEEYRTRMKNLVTPVTSTCEYEFLVSRDLDYVQYCPASFTHYRPGSLWETLPEFNFYELKELKALAVPPLGDG